jgi:hypothetical protein
MLSKESKRLVLGRTSYLMIYFHCLALFLGELIENLLKYFKHMKIDNMSGSELTEGLDILVYKTKIRKD